MSVEPAIETPTVVEPAVVAPVAATPTLGGAPAEATPTTVTPVAEPVAPTVTPSWRDSLSEDLRANPTLANIKDVESLAREHVGVQKLIGADKVVIPGEDATPEEIDAFQTRMGRPAKAEDYDLADVEIPEGLPIADGFQEEMVKRLHARGASQEMVSGLLKDYYELTGGQFEQMGVDSEHATAEGMTMLRNEWGKSFPAQVEASQKAFLAATGDRSQEIASIKLADGRILGDHPDIIKAFANLGGKMSEHSFVGGTAQPRVTSSPKEAQAEINKITADESFQKAYGSASHPEHAAAVQRMNDLIELTIDETE